MPRAITFSDEQIAQVQKLAGWLTQEQIADFFGISSRTLRRRFHGDPRVVSAYKSGRARATEDVTNALRRLIDKDNPAAVFFWLKCQAGWRETDPRQMPGDELPKLTDKQLESEKRRMGIVR